MTHSLHRRGTPGHMKKDYVVMLLPSRGINETGSEPKIKKYLEILNRNEPVNIGGIKVGHIYNTSIEEICNKVVGKVTTYNAVYDTKESIIQVLKELKEADLGISIIISGVYEEVRDACRQAGLKPHTVNMSLGIMGKTEKLPDENTLTLTTMCGHGMIASNLVKEMADQVKGGMDPEEAAKVLVQPCHCALFNVRQAAQTLKKMAGK